jgi:hypothetical protein
MKEHVCDILSYKGNANQMTLRFHHPNQNGYPQEKTNASEDVKKSNLYTLFVGM